MKEQDLEQLKRALNPKKDADKQWFLSLLDEQGQFSYEEKHLALVLQMLKAHYIVRYQKKIREIDGEIERIRAQEDYAAGDYRSILEKQAERKSLEEKLETYRCYFAEPYFARIDVTDDREGYNSYYIGKKGDVHLEIVDWRAPLAVRYYQKTRVSFSINEYEYRTILRRALSVKNGKVLDFRNEYLSVKDYLTAEEIGGRDEEILFDPYLRRIIKDRKDDFAVRDIIETIQEKQFEIITRPERESFVLQGCAGSGKTMILLHRLSYLMYNNENLRPRDVLVITPSDSFNAFIDDLSKVLELQKVRTITLQNYYFQALQNEGIALRDALTGEKESEEYLTYLYSPRFLQDVKKDIKRAFDDAYGMFAGAECREVAEQVYADCKRRQEKYVKVKNASLRVRRTVLGEMKEKKDGGFFFTKPMRSLMSALVQVEDFLTYVLHEEVRSYDYFFRQFAQFYQCAQEVSAHANGVFRRAVEDLEALLVTVEKEIVDLRRYRQKLPTGEVYTYPERIERRQELKREIESTIRTIGEMGEGIDLFGEFFAVVRSASGSSEIGKCKNALDVARWIYRITVKKYKKAYGLKGIFPSDGYAICAALTEAGRRLTPRYGLVFIDEGQDLSEQEYELLKRIHTDAAFNVFGDLKQNITPWRGVSEWGTFDSYFELNVNYRNTNEIVGFVSRIQGVQMQPIGLHGEEVKFVSIKKLASFFKDKSGLKAVICKEAYLPLFERRGYCRLSEKGASKNKINVMTVYESKGLEFSAVAVYEADMTENEKYIAYTRALRELAVIKE